MGGKQAVEESKRHQLSYPFSHKCSMHLTTASVGENKFSAAFHCRHASYDLQGVFHVFSTFQAALADVLNGQLPARRWGDEVPRLTIPTEQACQDDLGSFTPEQIAEGNRVVREQMSKVAEPHFNLPYKDAPNWAAVSSGACQRANVKLSQEETASLIKAVKKAKLSMTPFLVACAMHQLKKYSPPTEQHAFMNVINRRRYLAKDHQLPSSEYELWPYFGNVVQVLHAREHGQDPLTLAREVYARQWEDLHPDRPRPLWGLELGQQMYNDSLIPFNPAQPPAWETGAIYVSSPGPIDKALPADRRFGPVQMSLLDFDAQIRMTSAHSLLHIWTIGGQLELQTTIPKWYDQKLTQNWMEDTKRLLIETSQDIHASAAKL